MINTSLLASEFAWAAPALDQHFQLQQQILVERTSLKFSGQTVVQHDWRSVSVISDDLDASHADAVFPLHAESILLATLIPEPIGARRFLDVGSGSGLLSIEAARKGWSADTIDINPRALEFTRKSAELSGQHVNTIAGDFREFAPAEPYDFITMNLPFEPTAGLGVNFIHSDGGLDGQDLNREMLRRLGGMLSSNGRAALVTFSLVKDGRSIATKLLKELSGFSTLQVRLSDELDLDLIAARYGASSTEVARSLRSHGFDGFIIELMLFSRNEANGELEQLHLPLADKSWVNPIGSDHLAEVADRHKRETS